MNRGHPPASPPLPSARHTLLLLPLVLVLLCSLAHAQPRKVYLRACDEEDLRSLADLRAAIDESRPERAANILDKLFASASRPDRINRLVRIEEFYNRGLRSHLIGEAGRLPPAALAALRALQQERAQQSLESQEPPGPAALVRRYPASQLAGEAAEALWTRAFESGDLPRCRALERFFLALHPDRLKTPEGRARRALLRAASGEGPAARAELAYLEGPLAERTASAVRTTLQRVPKPVLPAAPAPQAELVEFANVGLVKPPPGETQPALWQHYSPAFARSFGKTLVVSNGATIGVFGLDGKLRSKIPRAAAAATRAPAPTTGFQGRIAGRPAIGFSALVLERWLAPARSQPGGKDASLADRFYSLVAFDPLRGRVLWWDGDSGRNPGAQRPPGWSKAKAGLLDVLGRGHVLATAADARRVYVALTIKGEEPELQLVAFEVDGGDDQPVVLRPAWSHATYVCSAERAQGSSEDAPVAAEIAASLALDDQGRLVCTTNVGVTACAETAEGQLLWVREAHPDRRQQGDFRSGVRRTHSLAPPPEPARFLETEQGLRVLFFGGRRLVSVRPEEGTEVWQRDCGPCHRLIAAERQLVAYGGNTMLVFAPDGTRLTPTNERMARPVVGEGLRLGSCLLLPTLNSNRRGRRSLWIDRFDFRIRGSLGLKVVKSTVLGKLKRAANLLLVPGGVVATSRDRVVFLRWE